MSIDLTVQYPGKVGPATAQFPYGEPRNITAPSDGTGTPWEAAIVKDFIGFEQSLLKSASIVPSGTPDEVDASQYLQSLIELIAGRSINYDDSGAADAYVLDIQANQQTPDKIFNGMVLKFIPLNTNTGGACTANPFGVGALNVRLVGGIINPPAKYLKAGVEATLTYRTSPAIHLELEPRKLAIVTGTEVFAAVGAGLSAAEVSITHGLITDDVDFGGIIHNDAPTAVQKSTFSNAKIVGVDGRTIDVKSETSPTSSPTILAAPATGDIKMNVHNHDVAIRTITVDWWARERL